MEKTVQMVYDFIVQNPNLSHGEIAAGVGLKRTPYLRGILLSMWQQGYIVRWLDDSRLPARYRYFAQLTEGMEGM